MLAWRRLADVPLKRGLLRLWIVASGLWLACDLRWLADNCVLNGDMWCREFANTVAYTDRMSLVDILIWLAKGPVTVLSAVLMTYWVIQGFRHEAQ